MGMTFRIVLFHTEGGNQSSTWPRRPPAFRRLPGTLRIGSVPEAISDRRADPGPFFRFQVIFAIRRHRSVVGHPVDRPLVAFPAGLQPFEHRIELSLGEWFPVGIARKSASQHESIAVLPALEDGNACVMSDGVVQCELTSGPIGIYQTVIADDVFAL